MTWCKFMETYHSIITGVICGWIIIESYILGVTDISHLDKFLLYLVFLSAIVSEFKGCGIINRNYDKINKKEK